MNEAPHKFPWGKVIEDIDVGPYTIRAYHPHKYNNGQRVKDCDEDRIEYHGYINGKDQCQSWPTLDDALAGLIVCRHLGQNWDGVAAHFIEGIKALAK